ncbi:hypothetical protein C0Q70_06992 [Pomacea canaliculata]|uniref:Uncharacterized protein n=1 Tax=Pomacea canaliculata TaxID=400727 RepID=A0A2T7PDT3_POMCA|nr:hypothetical protein C0Q70_06992 [Pomacea canaliculata]
MLGERSGRMEEGFRTEDVKEGRVVKERGSGEKRVSVADSRSTYSSEVRIVQFDSILLLALLAPGQSVKIRR